MKRRTSNQRPEPWTQTGRHAPGGGAADPGGSAFGAGSEKQSGNAGTSGQSVPKSSKAKFRQERGQEQAGPRAPSGSAEAGSGKQAGPEADGTSGQNVPKSPYGVPAKSDDFVGRGGTTERADFGGNADKGAQAKSATTKFRQKSQQEQAAASKLRMEKRGEKLEAAKEKLAKQKPLKKPGPVKRAGQMAGGSVHGFVHKKIYEVEQENVGTEGAHQSEVFGESVYHHGSRFVRRKIREHPAKAVSRAEAKFIKARADYHFHTAAQEHPELAKNYFTRYWQKRRLRKQYQKQAREAAKQGAAAAGKTAAATEKLAAKAAGVVKRHPVGCLLALACVLLIFMMQSCSSSLVMLGNAGAGALGATTYPSEDGEILGAEAAYSAMEAELNHYLDTYEDTHSYDEYHFDLDTIEHDPYVLISILSALYEGEWTAAQVQGTLQTLFDRQYVLTERVVRETRYDSDDEPYSWYICYVTLTTTDMSRLPVSLMGEDQLSRYAIYMSTLGNRPDLFPGSAYVDRYIENPPEIYEVPPEYLDDETFAAMLSEAEKYIGYPYVWGGSSPATSFDCSGYLSWVINHSGWSVGRQTAQGLYNLCTPVRSPRPGDLVFFKGTYDTPGVSHCGIYVGDGRMLHCGDPIGYANLNTSYWQSHFYAYGRLP